MRISTVKKYDEARNFYKKAKEINFTNVISKKEAKEAGKAVRKKMMKNKNTKENNLFNYYGQYEKEPIK